MICVTLLPADVPTTMSPRLLGIVWFRITWLHEKTSKASLSDCGTLRLGNVDFDLVHLLPLSFFYIIRVTNGSEMNTRVPFSNRAIEQHWVINPLNIAINVRIVFHFVLLGAFFTISTRCICNFIGIDLIHSADVDSPFPFGCNITYTHGRPFVITGKCNNRW